MPHLPWTLEPVIRHSQLLADGYRHWTGEDLIAGDPSPVNLARALYEAPFALLSHGTEADPLFNYANQMAQTLWELDWASMRGMPSRQSAERSEQTQRAQALGAAGRAGCLRGYQGVRISSRGRRFRILDGTLWSLLEADGTYRGQAACFSRWEFL